MLAIITPTDVNGQRQLTRAQKDNISILDEINNLTETDIVKIFKEARRLSKSSKLDNIDIRNVRQKDIEKVTKADEINLIKSKLVKKTKLTKVEMLMKLSIYVLEEEIQSIEDFKKDFGIDTQMRSIVHREPQKAEAPCVANLFPNLLEDAKKAGLAEETETDVEEPSQEESIETTIDDEGDGLNDGVPTGPDDDDEDDDPEPEPEPAPQPLPPVPEAKPEIQTTMIQPVATEVKQPTTEPVKEVQNIRMDVPRAISPRVQRMREIIGFHDGTKYDAYGRPIVRVRWLNGKATFDRHLVKYDDRYKDFMNEEVHEGSKLKPIYISMTLTDIIKINGQRELLAEPQISEIIERRRRSEENAFVIETISLTKRMMLMTDEQKHAGKKITASIEFMSELAMNQGKHGKWKVTPVKILDDKVHIIPLEQIESYSDEKEETQREYWFGSKKRVVDLTVRMIDESPYITSDDIDSLTWEVRDGGFFQERIEKNEDVSGAWRAQISGADRRRNFVFVTPVCRSKTESERDTKQKQLEKWTSLKKAETEKFSKLKGGGKIEVV
jgi:hypothetical protein